MDHVKWRKVEAVRTSVDIFVSVEITFLFECFVTNVAHKWADTWNIEVKLLGQRSEK